MPHDLFGASIPEPPLRRPRLLSHRDLLQSFRIHLLRHPVTTPLPPPIPVATVVLIGCGKSKRPSFADACDLYTGALFRARRAYAEASGHPWFIVSARHHLLAPRDIIAPYDARLTGQNHERSLWGLEVRRQLARRFDPRFARLELHMGADYAFGLLDRDHHHGGEGFHFTAASWPVRGLSIGRQLRWYKEQK